MPLKEILDLQTEDVIELHTILIEHTKSNETTQKRISLEKATRVLLLKRKELTSSLTDLGEGVLDTPYLKASVLSVRSSLLA